MKFHLTSIIPIALVFISFQYGKINAQAGTLDNSFSADGYALYAMPGYTTTNGTGIELESDGKYLVSGKVSSQNPSISKFLVIRVKNNGIIDSTFGEFGFSAHNTFGRSFAHDLGLQQDGKILVTGQDFDNVSITENIGVMRLNTDGSLDNTFGDTGRVDIDHGHTEEGHTIIQLADGKIVLTGHTDYDIPSNTIDGPTRTTFSLHVSTVMDRMTIHSEQMDLPLLISDKPRTTRKICFCRMLTISRAVVPAMVVSVMLH
jgi:uncharacterized delta-60 repeat protein